MTKEGYLQKMRKKGKEDALALQNKATENKATQTEIINQEDCIPNFDPQKDYTSWKANSPVRDEGQVWLLLQPYDANARPGKPSELRALWGLAHTKDPKKAKPWVASFGTSGMYMKDECCLWTDGKVYICLVDNNVYSPVDYARNWKLAEV